MGSNRFFLRYFNACGASAKYGEDHEPETHLIPNILKVALGQQTAVSLFAMITIRPTVPVSATTFHITDLAQAHCLALGKDVTGAFNLGTGEGCSVRQVVDMARRVTGHPIPVVQRPRRPGDPARLVAEAAKAERVLGWRPQHSQLEEIVRTAWAWHRTHPQGYGK